MASWSRSQSQVCGNVKAVSSGIVTRCSTHLARNEKVMLANKKENARLIRWAEEAPTYKKVRGYDYTIEVKLSRKTVRRLNGRAMSHEKRAEVLDRASGRLEFLRSCGVAV